MARNITARAEDYSQWYLDIIKVAQLADYAPVRGCMVIRPTGYSLWEEIQEKFDDAFKEAGHVNAYFPVLIPASFFAKEAEHVEGFAPECAVVTHAGGEKLEEPLFVRPTSETVIGHMYNRWIQSWRDLPILINQWCNVMRWEKRPRLFLRTSEFLWQEGHTAHATAEEAIRETEDILEIYRRIMVDELALSVVVGIKSEGERFPGAVETYTCEAMVTDTKALQAGTSHFLGQNFAKAFEIQFQNRDESMQFVWTTSWGVSTRLIGALIMVHSDDDGLVLPPRVAPVKVAIIPIAKETEQQDQLFAKAKDLAAELNKAMSTRCVVVDNQFHLRPSDRFFFHLQKGVPLRLELGEKEAAAGEVALVRRDTGERISVKMSDLVKRVPQILEEIQANLLERSRKFREDHTVEVNSFEDFKKHVANGWVKAYFAGSKEDEKAIKEATGATVRCFPLEDAGLRGTCVYTGKDNARLAIFSRSY